jgi:hypothetical protein
MYARSAQPLNIIYCYCCSHEQCSFDTAAAGTTITKGAALTLWIILLLLLLLCRFFKLESLTLNDDSLAYFNTKNRSSSSSKSKTKPRKGNSAAAATKQQQQQQQRIQHISWCDVFSKCSALRSLTVSCSTNAACSHCILSGVVACLHSLEHLDIRLSSSTSCKPRTWGQQCSVQELLEHALVVCEQLSSLRVTGVDFDLQHLRVRGRRPPALQVLKVDGFSNKGIAVVGWLDAIPAEGECW